LMVPGERKEHKSLLLV